MDNVKQAAAILVAKTQYTASAAAAFVATLSPDDVAQICELGKLQYAKAPISSFLDVIAARKQADDARAQAKDEQQADEAFALQARSERAFQEGWKAAQDAERAAAASHKRENAPEPAATAPVDPVSQETPAAKTPRKK